MRGPRRRASGCEAALLSVGDKVQSATLRDRRGAKHLRTETMPLTRCGLAVGVGEGQRRETSVTQLEDRASISVAA
jgi:hypothetical protein